MANQLPGASGLQRNRKQLATCGEGVGRRIRVLYVTAVAATQFAFLRGQNAFLQQRGFELHSIASPGADLDALRRRDGVRTYPLAISRSLSPLADLRSLIGLLRILRKVRPDILHVSTPKAALLGAVAGWIVRLPVRLFLIRGLALEAESGWKRRLYRRLEALTARLCTAHICVSPSLLELARAEGVLRPTEGRVVGNGMSNGIDIERFNPSQDGGAKGGGLVTAGASVTIGFVGRLAVDKGVEEIAAAWEQLSRDYPELRLLLVGPWDSMHPAPAEVRDRLARDPRVSLLGRVEDVVPYLREMDVFIYPTHGTEGFPNGPMEAAAMALPVVATDVVGCRDAIIPEVTGLLVPPKDVSALVEAVRRYIVNSHLRREHGVAARRRVVEEFRSDRVWEGYYRAYLELLGLASVAPRLDAGQEESIPGTVPA